LADSIKQNQKLRKISHVIFWNRVELHIKKEEIDSILEVSCGHISTPQQQADTIN
jgi:hypothetical protein